MNRASHQKLQGEGKREAGTSRTATSPAPTRHADSWNATTGTVLMVALLTCGCVSSTIQRDFYPTHEKKGYASISATIEPRQGVLWFKVYQGVHGKMKELGSMQAGGLLGGNSMDRQLTCAYHIVASAPPGKETFFIGNKEHPITVDIYECMTTRVTVVYSNPTEGVNRTTYRMSFEVDDPIKGQIKRAQDAQVGITGNRQIAGATFVVSGTDVKAVFSAYEAIEEAAKGLDLRKTEDAVEFKKRFTKLRASKPELSDVSIVCPITGTL